MNKITIIGNLTHDPDLRTTQSGIAVCSFSVAVNRRRKVEGQPEADYFRVTVWRAVAESCAKYLAKGRKVAVVGAVSIHHYVGSNGETKSNLEIEADEVEFLSSSNGSPER
ncbi:MAG: single-stranded DNA-binding protein [Clostridia bacterium]